MFRVTQIAIQVYIVVTSNQYSMLIDINTFFIVVLKNNKIILFNLYFIYMSFRIL